MAEAEAEEAEVVCPQAGDVLLDGLGLLTRKPTDINDVRRLECPDEGLDPRIDRRQEARPAEELHRFRFRVLAGDGDPAGQSREPHQDRQDGNDDKEQREECQVVPDVELESRHSFAPKRSDRSHHSGDDGRSKVRRDGAPADLGLCEPYRTRAEDAPAMARPARRGIRLADTLPP
jgi:hypothetical protein